MPDREKVLKPTPKTLRLLYAKSGNRCAFPGCPTPISDGKTLFGEAAHIKGESPLGPRYDPDQTAEQRRSYENLILLCGVHHKCVDDDVVSYTVERLIQMKRDHEAKAGPVDELEINQVADLLADTSISVTAVNPYNSITAGVFHQNITNVYGSPVRHEDVATPYPGVLPKQGKGRFRPKGLPLGRSVPPILSPDEPSAVYLQDGPCFWFRLLPTQAPTGVWSFRDLDNAAGAPHAIRLTTIRGFGEARLTAKDGIGRYQCIGVEQVYSVSFLFRVGEFWSTDTEVCRSFPQKFFAVGLVRQGLPALITEATNMLVALKIHPPFRWIAGVEGVEGFMLVYDTHRSPTLFSPRMLADRVVTTGIHSPGDDAHRIVNAFTDEVFAECGSRAPDDIV